MIVIGDDDHASTGPDAWPSWRRLKGWARAAMVHAAASDRDTYPALWSNRHQTLFSTRDINGLRAMAIDERRSRCKLLN
jgi:hypothetical protein